MSPRTINIGPCACCGETSIPCTDCPPTGSCTPPNPDDVRVDVSGFIANIDLCPECAIPEPCSPSNSADVTLYKGYDCAFYNNVLCVDGYDLHIFIDFIPDYDSLPTGYWTLTIFCYQEASYWHWTGCKAGNGPAGTYIHTCDPIVCMNTHVDSFTVVET